MEHLEALLQTAKFNDINMKATKSKQRTVKLQMQVSLDGFVSDKNGELDWMIWDWDKKLMEYVTEITKSVDCILLGRRLAQSFISHWKSNAENPDLSDPFARKMNKTSKIVFTKSVKENKWKNTKLANGNLVEEIKKLKKKKGGDIIVYGGGNFVRSLIKANLIDEYYLCVNPIILGKGYSIFKGVETPLQLELTSSKSFKCGIVVNKYQKLS